MSNAGVSVAAAISAIEDAGLQLPILAKPQHAGRPGSHELALVRDLAGLQSLVRLRVVNTVNEMPSEALSSGMRRWSCDRRLSAQLVPAMPTF